MNISGAYTLNRNTMWPGTARAAGPLPSLNDMVKQGNPEIMKDVEKQSLFGNSMVGDLVMQYARKNLETIKADVNLRTALAMAPTDDQGNSLETGPVRQAALQAKAAEQYSAEAAEEGSALKSKSARLLARGGAAVDLAI